MTVRENLKRLVAHYKRIEKVFFRADKSKEKTIYIRLKYQFRVTLAFSLLTILASISLLVLHQQFLPFPFVLLAACLVGFRYKHYYLPRTIFLIAVTISPIRYLFNNMVFTFPAAIIFSNVQTLVITQSEFFPLVHLIIQTLVYYFYGTEHLNKKIQSMTPQEIAEIAQTAFYICLVAAWTNLLTMQSFYSHMSTLLRKIGALWDNISKANIQLNDQNLKLQSNLEMKDVFIYTFSHELKNALNGLLGNLTLAYDTAKDPQMLKFLASAKVCGEVIKNFVHNILDSGKLENGNLEVSPERKDLMSFMENIWTICGRIIENKRLQGYLEVEKNVPRYLELDEQRMIQIVLNLVSNACKFTEKGHVRVHVSWQTICAAATQQDIRVDEVRDAQNSHQRVDGQEERDVEHSGDFQEFPSAHDGGPSQVKQSLHLITERPKKFLTDDHFYQLNLNKWHWNREETLPSKLMGGAKGILRIQVLDTGCGMTSEDQTMLFKRFSQTNRIAGQRKVGTGLGLWICKELAKGLDGEIRTRSEVGIGSVFELTIHTRVSHFTEKLQNSPSLNQDGRSSLTRVVRNQRPPNMMKTLIADDDSFNVELMKNYLKKFGISYIIAHDGEEAVFLFKKHYQDICFVITDNFMPKKLGTEAALDIANFLKEMKKPKIPIMCISGDVKVHVGEAGITSVIQKPINFERLKEELIEIYPQIRVGFRELSEIALV